MRQSLRGQLGEAAVFRDSFPRRVLKVNTVILLLQFESIIIVFYLFFMRVTKHPEALFALRTNSHVAMPVGVLYHKCNI